MRQDTNGFKSARNSGKLLIKYMAVEKDLDQLHTASPCWKQLCSEPLKQNQTQTLLKDMSAD